MLATNPFFSDLAAALDPIDFACLLGFDLDPWQRDLLLSTDKRIILNCARQSGKTEIVSILALYTAMQHEGSLILCVSPSLRQSGEMLKKVVSHYHDIGRPLGATIDSALTLQLSNRSRIVSLPGTEQTIRGYSADLICVDEAARVSNELYYAVRPMLAVSQGRIILLSTPCGKRGFFFREWEKGVDWLKIKITADDCPRIPKEFLAQERRDLGDRWFAQEYLCSFEEAEAALFHYDVIQRALCDDLEELHIDLEIDANDRRKADDQDANYLEINLD